MFSSLSDSDCSHSDSNHDSLEACFLQLDDYLVAATTCNQLLNAKKKKITVITKQTNNFPGQQRLLYCFYPNVTEPLSSSSKNLANII